MKEMVTLNRKEQRRLMVLNEVEMGKVIGREVAELLDLSLRHVRRILAAYRKEGAAALAHGNRGRRPHNALDTKLKEQVLTLARSTYAGCNNQHFTELLAERESIDLSRSAVRRILLKAGIRSPRKRHPPKHHSRRERYPKEGMLLQTDGSHHDWLEGRGPYLSLVGAIDDATGASPLMLYSGSKRMPKVIFSCCARLWPIMAYLWPYTMMVMAYLSVLKESQSHWRNNLREEGSPPSLAG